jgi:hypothetical protein
LQSNDDDDDAAMPMNTQLMSVRQTDMAVSVHKSTLKKDSKELKSILLKH